MSVYKLAQLLQDYMQHTGEGEVDTVADSMREAIEEDVHDEDAQLFWGAPEGEQLRAPLSRVLKDATAKDHETQRRAARGSVG
jgi:hypothetical protein